MKTLDQTPTPVNFAAAEVAYKAASAAVDARIEHLDREARRQWSSVLSVRNDSDPELLALIAAEESAYEAMFHAASERQRRARMMVSGAFETDARPEVDVARVFVEHVRSLGFALLFLLMACGSDDAGEPDDEPSGCVCDAFGPPGIFDPSTCDDGEECCDADEDGIADAAPTRIVCVGGGK